MIFTKEAVYNVIDPGQPKSPYDLSEDASRRSEGGEAADMARLQDNDDINEENESGMVNGPDDAAADNKLWTSLSED